MNNLRTTMLLMAQYNKALLDFNEVCSVIGILPSTGRNWKSQRRFPIPLIYGDRARLQDVADWIDLQAKSAA